jgi:hypothetical protein
MGLKHEKAVFFSFLVWLAFISAFFFIITDKKTEIKIKLYHDLYEILDVVYASCGDDTISIEQQDTLTISDERHTYSYRIDKVLEPFQKSVIVSIDLHSFVSGACKVSASITSAPFGPDQIEIDEEGNYSFIYTKDLNDQTGYIDYAASGRVSLSGISCKPYIDAVIDMLVNKGVVKSSEEGKISMDETLYYKGPLYCEREEGLFEVFKTSSLKKVIEKGNDIYVIFDHDFILKSSTDAVKE